MADMYGGGRSLDAIWKSKSIPSTAKLVLLCFTKELNFNGQFDEWRYYSNESFIRDTSLKIRCVRNTLNWLVDNGYLERKLDNSESGRRLCNSFRLTEKLFTEAFNAPVKVATEASSAPVKVATGASSAGGRGHQMPPNSFIITPIKKNYKTTCVNTPNIIAPEVDPFTHTSDQIILNEAKKIRKKYFRNSRKDGTPGGTIFSYQEMETEICLWLKITGREWLEKFLSEKKQGTDYLSWQTEVVRYHIEIDFGEQMWPETPQKKKTSENG